MNDQKLYRSKDRIIGGVCAGLAEAFHVDPLWVRIAFVALIFVQGVGLFLYVVLWLVMPERLDDGSQRSGFSPMTADLQRVWRDVQGQLGGQSRPAQSSSAAQAPPTPSPAPPQATPTQSPTTAPSRGTWQNPSQIVGVVIVVGGLVLLGNNIGIINWGVVWPAALITLGIVILVRNLEPRP